MFILKENITKLIETPKAVGILLTGMEELIWIPKSQITCFPNFEKATKFEIPDWLWDKKIEEHIF